MEPAPPVVERLEVGPLQTNCYVLKSDDELAVIDPGGDGPGIIQRIAELGGRVKYVINTHGHVDHMAANTEVLAATDAILLAHRLDVEMLVSPERNLAAMMGFRVCSPEPAQTLEDGDIIEVGGERLTVVHTPGHTPGGICLLGSGYAFTGDTLFVDSIGRIDLPGGNEMAMRGTLARLQALLRKETAIYPGHGLPGTFGRALLVNPFLGSRWPA